MKQSYRLQLPLFIFLQITCSVWGQSNYADCVSAQILCDKAPITLNELTGYGNFSENSLGTCFQNDFQETNSIWFKWKVANAGTLAFTILPLNEADDIDFVVYRIKGINNCPFKESVRCMAAGPILGTESEIYQGCTGATGLRAGAEGGNHPSGCPKDGKNFLMPIDMKVGEYYALFINNFRSTGGALIEWAGTGNFQPFQEQCVPQSSTLNSTALHSGGQLQFSEAFPNPATDRVSITALSDEEHNGQIQVIGSDGRLELSMPFTVSAGSNTIELPTETLRQGVHFVKLHADKETHLLRFVKH